MICLTVREPFAAIIVIGLKTIECPGSHPRFRGPLLIHAGLGTLPLDTEISAVAGSNSQASSNPVGLGNR